MMSLISVRRRLGRGFCALLLAGSGAAHGIGLPFTVDDSAVPGAFPVAPFVVNGASFTYQATATQASLLMGPAPFSESGFLQAASYQGPSGVIPSQLNSPEIIGGFGYGIYGLFKFTGTAALLGPIIQVTFATASVELWLDPLQNTTKTLPATGAGAVTLGFTADDLKIGSSSTLADGDANVNPFALASGDFDIILEPFTLTALGATYWTAPSPFHMRLSVDGNIQNVPLAPAGFTETFTGAGNAQFVAEPSSLALAGLALVGLGVFARRRKVT